MDKKLFAELLESVKEAKAIREGKAKAARVTRYKALDPKAIRTKSGLTQDRFAALLGVKLSTYRNWEQGRRVPHGPAQVLLMVAEYDPMVIRRAIRAQREEPEPQDAERGAKGDRHKDAPASEAWVGAPPHSTRVARSGQAPSRTRRDAAPGAKGEKRTTKGNDAAGKGRKR